MNVAQKVFDRSGKIIPPGSVGQCPIPDCGENEFCVSADDDIGVCGACGHRVYADAKPPEALVPYQRFLAELLLAFAAALWRASNRAACADVELLRDTLGFDERLCRLLGIGLVPEDLDRDALMALVQQDEEDPFSANAQQHITTLFDELLPLTHGIVFPHTTMGHWPVGFRVLNPNTKALRDFRLFPGAFGHSLAYPHTGVSLPLVAERLFLVPDELTLLTIQSALIRAGNRPARVCAMGNLAHADWLVIDALCGQDAARPLVICDASSHPAIRSLATSAQQFITLDAHELARPNNILNLFAPKRPPQEVIQSLLDARTQAFTLYRPFAEVAKQALAIRVEYAGVNSEFLAHRKVSDVVLRDVLRRGEFLNCGGSPYWQDTETKTVLPIGGRAPEYVGFMAKYGVVATENIFRFLGERLMDEARKRGRVVELPIFAHWNEEHGRLYLDLRNGHVLIVDGQNAPAVQPNGFGGVLFLPLVDAEPFNHTLEASTHSVWAETLIDRLHFTDEGALTPADRRFLFSIYVLSLFFSDLMPTKPIVAIIGVRGSGKSTACRAIGKTLIGDAFDVASVNSDNRRDVEAFLSNSFYTVLDNMDASARNQNSLNDLLATTATGGTLKKRELFTTNTMTSFKLRCFVAITSRTPKFNRDDISDRVLPFRVQRLKDFMNEAALQDRLRDRRDLMWTETIQALQTIIKFLKQTPQGSRSATLRMADFDDFGFRICKGLGLDAYWTFLVRQLIKDQSEFTLSGNNLYEAVKSWLQKNNWNREIDTGKLYDELSDVAESENIFWKFGNAQSFGQSLANIIEPLREFFQVDVRIGHARARFYTFKKKPKIDDDGAPSEIPAAPAGTPPFLANLYRYAEESIEEHEKRRDLDSILTSVQPTKLPEPLLSGADAITQNKLHEAALRIVRETGKDYQTVFDDLKFGDETRRVRLLEARKQRKEREENRTPRPKREAPMPEPAPSQTPPAGPNLKLDPALEPNISDDDPELKDIMRKLKP